MTRDGHLVCVHDRTVNRTSDGQGVVSELDLQGLNALDFASWRSDLPALGRPAAQRHPVPGRRRARPRRHGGGVLTLEMLLGLVHDASRDGAPADRDQASDPLRRPGREGARRHARPLRLGRCAARAAEPAARRRDLDNRVVVMSFAPIGAAPGQTAGAGRPDRAAARSAAAGAPRRRAARRGPDRRSGTARAAGRTGLRRTRPRPRSPGLRLDGRRACRRRLRAATSASTRSSPTGPPTSCNSWRDARYSRRDVAPIIRRDRFVIGGRRSGTPLS